MKQKYVKNILFILIFSGLVSNYVNGSQKIFIITIPKSGSNLLIKLVKMLLKINDKELMSTNPQISEQSFIYFFNQNKFKLCTAHAFCNEKNLKIFTKYPLKGFFIYRDPRDNIVSLSFYLKRPDLGFQFSPKYQNMTNEKIIFDLISNFQDGIGDSLYPIDKHYLGYNRYLDWIYQSFIYSTTFEKLVGPKGGGDLEVQLTEIQNIAKHIGLNITRQRAQDVASKLFGGPGTFRAGQIGDWKKHFTQKHKKAFKKVAGQLLIDLGYEEDFDW